MLSARTHMDLIVESDFDELLRLYQEPDTFKYITGLRNKSLQFYRDFVKLKFDQRHSGKAFYWVLRTISEKALVGAINLTPIPKTDQIQIGWQISTHFQRKGFAMECAKRAMRFALEETEIDTIRCVFEKENIASGRLAESLNFEFESVLVESEARDLQEYIWKR